MATTAIGKAIVCDLVRSEDDTDDIVVHLVDPDDETVDANVLNWTAVLSVGPDNDSAPVQTFNGVGIAGGLIPIDMAGFAVPKGSYKYDIRITDTVTGDTPARVYFKGKMKVTPRIN